MSNREQPVMPAGGVEYGFRWDCFGHCDITHPGHGEVIKWPALFSEIPPVGWAERRAEEHPGVLVRRTLTVTFTEWETVEDRVPEDWSTT